MSESFCPTPLGKSSQRGVYSYRTAMLCGQCGYQQTESRGQTQALTLVCTHWDNLLNQINVSDDCDCEAGEAQANAQGTGTELTPPLALGRGIST